MIRGIACIPDFSVLIFIYFLIFFPRWKPLNKAGFLIRTVFYIYLCMVIYFTLMPVLTSAENIYVQPYGNVNLSPFIDIAEGHLNAEKEILLNILMMIPFGFLLPMVRKRSLLSIVSAGFLMSFCIECLQPVLSQYRAADITDLITNTLGTLIGCLLYRLVRKPLEDRLQRLV